MAHASPPSIGGIGLVRGHVRGLNPAMRDLSLEIHQEIKEPRWLESAPFQCVNLIVRFGEGSDPACLDASGLKTENDSVRWPTGYPVLDGCK